ncbi:MAG: SLBB domain-containing protein [Deltaproteobacteria bacterium]|nr:SLBB domain-containing protein [Deltaproteobacteria bacterium]
MFNQRNNIVIACLFGCLLLMPFSAFSQEGFGQALGVRKSLSGTADSKGREVRSFGSQNQTVEVESSSIPFSALNPAGSGTESPVFYNVHVLGEVGRPGVYKIRPSDRVTDALQYAGGQLPNGSTRRLQLRREGSTRILDLFAYKYNGLLDNNPYLMENDVIFVPVKKGEIQVEGPVNRPGNYEITRPISLAKAVAMAGGFSVGLSAKTPIRIVRFNGEEKKEIIEVENSRDEMAGFEVKKGDAIVVPHILIADKEFDYNLKRIPGDNIFYPTIDDNVYVIGAVSLPGAYEFKPHYTYKEYVSLAGPVRDAKMRSIRLIRSNGKKLRVRKSTTINAGDTLVVPQRYWKPEVVAGWLGTVTNLTLSTLVITDRFK